MIKDLKPIGGKAPMHLLPLDALGAVAGAMEHGNVKYAPWNFRDKSQAQARLDVLVGAVIRHALAISDPGQDSYDPESGLHHAAHVGSTALLILDKLGLGYRVSKLITPGPEQVEIPFERQELMDPADVFARKHLESMLGPPKG